MRSTQSVQRPQPTRAESLGECSRYDEIATSGYRQEADSIAVVRKRRNLCDPIVPSEIEEPGAGPGMMTEGCASLECHSRNGRARSSTPVLDQPGSCS